MVLESVLPGVAEFELESGAVLTIGGSRDFGLFIGILVPALFGLIDVGVAAYWCPAPERRSTSAMDSFSM